MQIEFEFQKQKYVENIEDALELSEMTPSEIMEYLNKAPSKFAYWSTIMADILEKRRAFDLEYELWWDVCYDDESTGNEKMTEGWKKTQARLTNVEEYTKRQKIMQKYDNVASRCQILIESFKMQVNRLQSIGALKRAELQSIASGDLSED